MENKTNAMIAGVVAMAVLGFLCLVQAGCGGKSRALECAACDCSDSVRTATEEAAAQNKALAGDLETLRKQAMTGTECLAREEARKNGEELKQKAESEACDADLIDSSCMENVCPFDPQKASPFRTLTTEEKLAASYVHSLEYWHCEHYLKDAFECSEGKQWSKYTRTQVQAQYDCLRGQYYKAHKDVVLYTKPLGMHFAAPGGEDYGYEPALRVVLDIMRDIDRDQAADSSAFGVTTAQLIVAYQSRFREALDFYEAKRKACDEGKDTFRDRDGSLQAELCDLVTDFSLYAAYPDPLKNVTRAEMAKRLKCEEEQ